MICCEECRKTSGIRRTYRLHPTNWHRDIRLLCRNCRVRLGYALIEYERPRQKAVLFGIRP